MSITTKKGDGGQTDLLGGVRVSKSDIRVECCGAADELGVALGLAKSLCDDKETRGELEAIQQDLLVLGAELAGGDPAKGIGEEAVARLEGIVDRVGVWRGFVLPGADPVSAALHLARTVCRRLERALVRREESGYPLRDVVLSYVNRLSDALYALACISTPE